MQPFIFGMRGESFALPISTSLKNIKRELGRNVTKEALQEEPEEVFLAMVEPRLNLLQIYREAIFRHSVVVVQDVLGK